MWKQVSLVVLLVLWAHVYADESHEALAVHASAEDAPVAHAANKRQVPHRSRREGPPEHGTYPLSDAGLLFSGG